MEILDIDNCKLTEDTIKNTYTQWRKFYDNCKVFDVDKLDEINNEFIKYKYCIINNNKLVGLLVISDYIDNERKAYVFIELITSNEHTYLYEIIRSIIDFYKDKNKEYIKIYFEYIHGNPIIKKIIKNFDGFCQDYYILNLYKYKYSCTFNENLNIEIILYENPSKTSILCTHKSNIIFTKELIKSKYPYFYMLNIFKNKYIYYELNKKKHKFYSLKIIFEKKIELTGKFANNTNDIWFDININYNNKKINLNVGSSSYDLRLNKLNDISINNYYYSYIYAICSTKYDCECNECDSKKKENPYYFNNETSKNLYEFIDNNFNKNILDKDYKFYRHLNKKNLDIGIDLDYDILGISVNKWACIYPYT